MNPRIRKLIGLAAILLFITLYVGVAARIGEHLPDRWWAKLAFYAVAGIGWGVPIFPLISWMNRGRFWGRDPV